MDTTSIKTKVREIVANYYDVDIDEVTPDCKIIEDFDGDSLDCITLVYSFDTEFSISIPLENIDKLSTLQDWQNFIIKMMET